MVEKMSMDDSEINLDFSELEEACKYKGPLTGLFLTTKQLAELFGVSLETVRQWELRGYVCKEARNKWSLPEVVRSLYRVWREHFEEA